MDKQDYDHNELDRVHSEQIESLFGKSDALKSHIQAVEKLNDGFRDKLINQMPKEKVEDLIPGVTVKDLEDDNGHESL